MRISSNMLKRYIDKPLTKDELYEITNEYITEVESVETLLDIENFVVGHVLKSEPHPNADKLSVCLVDLGGEAPEQIVCGAPNVKAGQYVGVAQVGAILPGNFEIKAANIRGVDSNGMICSLDELGYGDKFDAEKFEGGIFYFDKELQVGSSAASALALDQVSLELDLTPNRADLLSVLGYAYDLAAALDIKVNYVEPKIVENGPKNPLKVTILDAGCKRYYARYLDNVTVGPSPLWMQADLLASGIRPINNVVDVTNYVLMELGTPLHAFDAKKFKTNEIVIQGATDLQEVITLDEQVRILRKDDIVITNGVEVVALGGVMGLLNTMVDNDTTSIILEAASFESSRVKETSRRLDLISDSSLRFERGIDELRVRTAINRAAELLHEIAGARVYEDIVFNGGSFDRPTIINLTAEQVNKSLGTELTKDEVKNILKRLNIIETKLDTYLIPSYRNDLKIPVDLIEEVGRIYGFNNIPTTLPKSENLGKYSGRQTFEHQLRKRFKYLGFNEVINYSLGDNKDIDLYKDPSPTPIKLVYPLRDDRAYLRHSLINGLVETVNYNLSRQHEDLNLFEVGNIYYDDHEPLYLAAIISGKYIDGTFTNKNMQACFSLMKGFLEDIFNEYNVEVDYVKEQNIKGFHPGVCARILLNDETLGFVGKIHPEILDDAYAFEINLEQLYENINPQEKYELISRYPSIERDIAIVVDNNIEASKISALIKQTTRNYLTNIEVFDLYKDSRLGENKVSIGFRMTFNSKEKTLKTKDVDKMMKSVIFRLQKEFNAEIRQ